MNKPCAKCNKTVYPVEKLTCLDKIWHKACFACNICNMKLTMKSYKGYNKLPYCVTHYPTTKFTAVVDTPENKRLAKQQMNQSELIYRKDKKAALEGFTQVADSVSSRQAAHSAKLASNLKYQTAPHQVGREGKDAAEIVNRKNEEIEVSPPQPAPPQTASSQSVAVDDVAVDDVADQIARVELTELNEEQSADEVAEKYVAMYDYTAADDDEVTFVEGDIITEGVPIDAGWMEGLVVRTGCFGMLPSNYVKKI